ncbi:hypothetical protein GJAV_G00222270 [Gymnothorax javanicus]|nr:hypothetical protein GJAV_G00222270 [Gymnothorax javanicus]
MVEEVAIFRGKSAKKPLSSEIKCLPECKRLHRSTSDCAEMWKAVVLAVCLLGSSVQAMEGNPTYGVKLCGREFIRAVIFTCGGSRWRRSARATGDLPQDAFTAHDDEASDSWSSESVPGLSYQQLPEMEAPSWAKDGHEGAFLSRSARSLISEEVLEALRTSDRKGRDVVVGLSNACCKWGCSSRGTRKLFLGCATGRDDVDRPRQPSIMTFIWAGLFTLFAHLHPQARGVNVTCLWERHFLVGSNVSGACHVGQAASGCGVQSLRLTAAGEAVLAYGYRGDSALFTVPAFTESTLHLHCELPCTDLRPLPHCDITLQGGYPPPRPLGLECLVPFGSSDIHCSWDPGERPLLPVSYTLHWLQFSSEEREVEAGAAKVVISQLEFSQGTMTVWVVASNLFGSSASETLIFDTLDVIQPPAPNITHHLTPHLEVFWDLDCDQSEHMTEDADQTCEVQYRIGDEQGWTEGDSEAQDRFLLLDPRPFSKYDFRVRCACFGSESVQSNWSNIYSVQSPEAAPSGKLDVWSDCKQNSTGQLKCAIVWKRPSPSVARGKVLMYQVTVEHNLGDVVVMNVSAEELGVAEEKERVGECGGVQCYRLPLSLQGVTGVNLVAHTSQGGTDPAILALPGSGSKLQTSGDFVVTAEGWRFNVSWTPLSHFFGDVEYVVQLRGAGVHPMFDWIKLNGSQSSVTLIGDFRNYTPYNISLFSVIADRRCLLGSTITYILQGVPSKVTGFQVSQIGFTEVTLTWGVPLHPRRGVILRYLLGQGNQTEHTVSGNSSSLQISGLHPGQQYHFWICAESEAGLGPKEFFRFATHATKDYVIYVMLLLLILLALGLILPLLICRKYGVHSLKQFRCCRKVPDPINSRLFRQSQCNWKTWTGCVAESVQKLSDLEIVEKLDLEDCGSQEWKVRQGWTRTEEEEAEEEWSATLDEGESDLGMQGDDYSKMIDSEGDEESVSRSPTETQEFFFSGYEKHFMPSPLEV